VTVVERDEGPRKETSLGALAKLKPAFKSDGRVTPGNSSPMNDGGAAVVISSRNYAEKNNLKPMAKIVGYAQAAVEPKYLFAAPVYAIPKLLKKINWSLRDVDLIELNSLRCTGPCRWIRPRRSGLGLEQGQCEWRRDRIGTSAGEAARGVHHVALCPERPRLKRGIAALCLGGGEAVAGSGDGVGN
jgi:acetyl-CoA C-acetyltransferase